MKSTSLIVVLILGFITTFSQNVGTISFSKTPLGIGHGGTENIFQAGDAIYANAVFLKPLKEYFKNRPPAKKHEFTIFIYEKKAPLYSYQDSSEEQLTFATMWISGDAMNQNQVSFEIAPIADKCQDYSNPDYYFQEFGKKYDGPVNYTENLGKLLAGKHDLIIMVRILDEEVSNGRFTISGDDYAFYTKLSELLNQVARRAGAKLAVIPKALKTDKALEARMVAALKNSNDWKSARINSPQFLKLHIIDSDWYIRRNELTGVILHRYIRAAVAVKTKSGECGYYPLVSFQEDYVGGKFQPLRYDGIGDFVLMDCANLNK